MEIIKLGKRAKEMIEETTCAVCDTVYSYTPKDVHYPLMHTGGSNGDVAYVWVFCPICNRRHEWPETQPFPRFF